MKDKSLLEGRYRLAEELFDCLPDAVFFVKDASGRYIAANATLVNRCGANDKSDLVGKTPSQVLGPELGVSYEKQDRSVLETGAPILDQLELHSYPNRSIGWCLTNKRALFDRQGKIAGLAGVSRDLRTPDPQNLDYQELLPVVAYVEQYLDEAPSVSALSKIAGLSPYQLDRRMRRTFGLSTGQWVLQQRLDQARRLLLNTDTSIAEIALSAGYRDQSAFSRQFLRATGLAPSAFRRARGRGA